MLLSFEVENYKSFKDRIVFSMEPAPKQKGLDYSVIHETIGNKNYKGLSCAVIYGANASGKTNLIGAIQALRTIVLRGNIRNQASNTSANAADCFLELIPNKMLKEAKPVDFVISFIHSHNLYTYKLKCNLGRFMDKNPSLARSVVWESLEMNGKEIFVRTDNSVEFSNLKSIEQHLTHGFIKNKKAAITIASTSLTNEDLFLTNGFKNIVSSNIANVILQYFSFYLNTIYHFELMENLPVFTTGTLEDKFLNQAVKEFGINSNKLVYIKQKEGEPPALASVMDDNTAVPAAFFESYGTMRFVNLFPMIIDVLKIGGTLVIDEFDASIHPMAIMSIIKLFHNDEINIHHAQLIFNTHNPLYLNNNLLRRDEIKFVERDDDTKCSKHYSLSDFGTTGTKARKGKDYMDNYFVNEYGAIRDIDFSSVVEKIIKG